MGENYGGGRCLQKTARGICTSGRRAEIRGGIGYERKVPVAINVNYLKEGNSLLPWNTQMKCKPNNGPFF